MKILLAHFPIKMTTVPLPKRVSVGSYSLKEHSRHQSVSLPDYNEEEAEAEAKHDDTPSLSFSTTETLSSWMREANMDADIQSYTKSSILRRDEYFFRIWYYASKLFK